MMSNDRLTELEHRLALAEREVEKTRAQVRALQAHERRRWRLRRDGILALLSVSLLVFAVTRAIDTEAQGTPQVLRVKAPFEVVDASGKKVILSMKEFGNGMALQIGDTASGGLTIGVGATGAGGLTIHNKDGNAAIVIGQRQGAGMGVYVNSPDGQTVAGSLALSPSNKGRLVVGDPKSGGVDAGVGSSGAGFMVVRRDDGKTGIDMSQLDGRPMAVGVFGENAKEVVTVGAGQKGGSVKVMTAAGIPVAALLAGDTGGGVAITGPTGGKSAISLAVEPTGGKVRVYPQGGGSTQAELTAASSGGGSVVVYNPAGQAVAWVESTSKSEGSLEIGRAGKTYVKAGVLESGVGMVATGPQVGGAPVGMVTPNILVGRIGGK